MKVSNFINEKGRAVPNQIIITDDKGRYFQSYQSIIVFIPNEGKIQLDSKYWNYSSTTSKYRNLFLGDKSIDTQRKIEDGTYELTNLNN